MLTFLFASDSFKGSISSSRAAQLLTLAARESFPGVFTRSIAVADGGEGTVDALVASGGTLVSVDVLGPRASTVSASYGVLSGGRAIIEMAAASGLPLLAPAERNPSLTSTYGTGQLIRDALDRGISDISLAIGGSATNDGGMGAMRALGARFLDAEGEPLGGAGADLGRVRRIDLSGMDPRLTATTFHVMCDVDNPLTGPRGATRVFGPQKGADPEMVEELERGMQSYANVLERTFGTSIGHGRGMGAAGGLGAAACLFLSAEMSPGIERVLDLVDFDRSLHDADLCVTGEGHADSQSAHGKVVSGVAARCREMGVPCVALVGAMDMSAIELLGHGVEAIVPTVIDCSSVDEALAHAEENYLLAAQRLFSLLRIGRGMRS